MMLPAFRGVGRDIEGLTNPRGFVMVDPRSGTRRSPKSFGVGVSSIAIPPVGPSPVPVGVPKTGFAIESMVTATARISARSAGRGAEGRGHLECRVPRRFRRLGRRLRRAADSAAQHQLGVRGCGCTAKVAYEKYFLRKMRRGESEPFGEKFIMDRLGIRRIHEALGVPADAEQPAVLGDEHAAKRERAHDEVAERDRRRRR